MNLLCRHLDIGVHATVRDFIAAFTTSITAAARLFKRHGAIDGPDVARPPRAIDKFAPALRPTLEAVQAEEGRGLEAYRRAAARERAGAHAKDAAGAVLAPGHVVVVLGTLRKCRRVLGLARDVSA